MYTRQPIFSTGVDANDDCEDYVRHNFVTGNQKKESFILRWPSGQILEIHLKLAYMSVRSN